ncbi:glycoside hydrolase family 113 [Seonamhaeicola maritimus]|uniref:Glycoside hydrolase n=1 Tax=Seonamhaeicola maritimus TaxID=2591822 RepID=A0A5C7GG78_9FLAO|nr:glycoside hydrolase TIM-barrel-like domain-containing protein [Seonamhaeicola maritimus]TXG36617.1 glycoside hydrolase [Seonamhaeicola maritimus]
MKLYRLFILFVLSCQSCNAQIEKINGVSFVASREAINQNHVKPVVSVNANYASVMPFGFLRTVDNPNVVYGGERQWYGETKEGTKQYIEELRKQHINIMLKPQIWVWRGEFTGYIKMNSEEDWKTLEASYSKFILDYAQLAEELKVKLFCIGTELETFIDNRPNYWLNLIKEIRKIYKGKLTYAANWDEFKRTPFWRELDFIGVDAYFPVSDDKTPSYDDALKGWKAHLPEIRKRHEAFDKPILFTEFGYRSVDFTGREPWKSDRSMNQVNLDGQTNTTKALFETFWKEDWFAGGFIWKWYHNHEKAGGTENTRFTPQNKPVEAIIKAHYAVYK